MAIVGIILAFLAIAGAILFGSAGRIDLPFFWAVLGIVAAFMLVNALVIDPDLRRERVRPGAGGLSRKFRVMVMPIILGNWIVAGLDVGRFHWSDTVPIALQCVALAGLAATMSLTMWATYTNRFFSPVIRIQRERGHHVVSSGPYAFIRHPGYVATVLAYFFVSLAFGSWLAAAMTVPYAAIFAYRTIVEERFLRANLPGYPEYASDVRWRWVPGVW